ncbi:MAG: LysM peptidoglycan-binding domain-containing protein [Verrucomicrobiae bacterium]|nr:LysM peptidoglycan-binding domain-containing protein [Verrucomicrobiae bacterium]
MALVRLRSKLVCHPTAPGARSGSTAAVAQTYDYKGGAIRLRVKRPLQGPVQPQARVPVVRKVKATTEPARSAAPAAPAAAAPIGAPATPVASVTPGTPTVKGAVVVAKGDTLHALALKHRVSVKLLMSANNLTNNIIFPGQKLVIPAAPR